MGAYLIRRSIQSVIALLGLLALIIFLLNIIGDPIRLMLPDDAPQAQVDAVRARYGYDRPLLVQFGDFYVSAAKGDFGDSIRYSRPAFALVRNRLPNTLWLGGVAFTIGLIGIPLGLLAALKPRS